MLFTPPFFFQPNQLPANVSSQAKTTQTFYVSSPCHMLAKLWGAGGGVPSGNPDYGGGGGYTTATFLLQTGDVVSYAAGGAGSSLNGSIPGSSGSGTRNGGTGQSSGGGCTELYINGVPVLLAGGGGAGKATTGGGGGGTNAQAGANGGGSFGGLGGGGGSPGAAGYNPFAAGSSGTPGSGGTGGNGGPAVGPNPAGGGGGGGYYGGGGGSGPGSPPASQTGGGGGSGYDSTGSGTLTTATNWQAANPSDPDRTPSAGNAENDGLVVLKFTL